MGLALPRPAQLRHGPVGLTASARVIIPTDEKVWEVIRRHAASPDGFIQGKIGEIARGEFGKPSR